MADEDYDVLRNGKVVGRIYDDASAGTPPDMRWFRSPRSCRRRRAGFFAEFVRLKVEVIGRNVFSRQAAANHARDWRRGEHHDL
jgi:hypothetical protein